MLPYWSRLSGPDADPHGIDGQQSPSPKLLGISVDHLCAGSRLGSGRESDQADDPRMRLALDDGQLAEILVQGHQDALFSVSAAEDLPISWILNPVTRPGDVVALVA